MVAVKNKQGWVIVDGVHCCYCQLAEYACPNHEDTKEAYRKIFNQPNIKPEEWLCKYCKNGGE